MPSTQTKTKYRTTFYLTEENKKMLDKMPRGSKTALINKALGQILKKMEKEENTKKFIEMISDITPVPTEYSSEEMVRRLRENKLESLFDDKQ